MTQNLICVYGHMFILFMVFLIFNSKYCMFLSKLDIAETSFENISKEYHPLVELGNSNMCLLRGGLS